MRYFVSYVLKIKKVLAGIDPPPARFCNDVIETTQPLTRLEDIRRMEEAIRRAYNASLDEWLRDEEGKAPHTQITLIAFQAL